MSNIGIKLSRLRNYLYETGFKKESFKIKKISNSIDDDFLTEHGRWRWDPDAKLWYWWVIDLSSHMNSGCYCLQNKIDDALDILAHHNWNLNFYTGIERGEYLKGIQMYLKDFQMPVFKELFDKEYIAKRHQNNKLCVEPKIYEDSSYNILINLTGESEQLDDGTYLKTSSSEKELPCKPRLLS